MQKRLDFVFERFSMDVGNREECGGMSKSYASLVVGLSVNLWKSNSFFNISVNVNIAKGVGGLFKGMFTLVSAIPCGYKVSLKA